MKSFTIEYKDHLGRNNKAERFAKDADEAKTKFHTLYANCVIVSVFNT